MVRNSVSAFLLRRDSLLRQRPRRPSQTDPLQCWWRTSAGAVRVGEPFTVVLTCAVLETDAATVVVDQTRLEPSVVQFAPFEVLGGIARRRSPHRAAPLLPVPVPAAADRRRHVRQGRRAAGDEDQLPRPEQSRAEHLAAGARPDIRDARAVDARVVAGARRRHRTSATPRPPRPSATSISGRSAPTCSPSSAASCSCSPA